MRAKMGASLPYSGLVDRLTAARAGVSGLLIDLEMVLKISAAVDPVDTGTVGFNPTRKGEPDSIEQPGGILQVEGFAGLKRVDAGSEERFIRVDISHSSQKMLVQ